jgi:hypothetical protein
MPIDSRLAKVGYVAAGLLAGGVLATTLSAQAASTTPMPSPSSSSGSSAPDPHPGDNGADGVPEAQEHHGGGPGGFGLGLTGTLTAVGSSSVTIKTAQGTTAYAVTSTSDIDKNGEAQLSDLKVGDVVKFSVTQSNAKQIDKLHAGDEAKNMPQRRGGAPAPSSSASPSSFT